MDLAYVTLCVTAHGVLPTHGAGPMKTLKSHLMIKYND